jgi:hypothetical protein
MNRFLTRMGVASTALGSLSKAKDYLPEMPSLPSLKIGRERAFHVHVIHTSGDPESYYFAFDFHEFFEGSKEAGMLTRPVFQVVAGRDDFDRRIFARQMRESFSEGFEEMRRADAEAKRRAAADAKKGAWGIGIFDMIEMGVMSVVTGAFILPLIYLMLGLLGLGAVLEFVENLTAKLKAPFAKKEATIEEEIDGARGRVDAALMGLKIEIDLDLWVNAMGPGYAEAHPEEAAKVRAASADGWPLPADVRSRLQYTARDLA